MMYDANSDSGIPNFDGVGPDGGTGTLTSPQRQWQGRAYAPATRRLNAYDAMYELNASGYFDAQCGLDTSRSLPRSTSMRQM